MSKLKISENLFLEVAELQRFRDFITEDGWKMFAKSVVKSYGIVENDTNSNYKPSKVDGSNDTIQINSGLAFDTQFRAIVSQNAETFIVTNAGEGIKSWYILEYGTRNIEKGTVEITADGTLNGTGTEFTKVLRGQPNFPTKVRLSTSIPQNQQDFEVVQVNSDSTAILSGTFYPEQGLKYSVVGTFTPGYQPLEENKLIYEFDDHKITVVMSESEPTLLQDQYLIASAFYDSYGVLQVVDERAPYMFNNEYNVNQNNVEGIVPIASLTRASWVGGLNAVNTISAELELVIEHGYQILDQTLAITENANILNIVSGKCNFLNNASVIPNDMFKDWILVNRKNMVITKIKSNSGSVLFLESVPGNLFLEADNELVVVPNFKEIEIEVKLNGGVNDAGIAFYFRNSISNPLTRTRNYVLMPDYDPYHSTQVEVKIRYRMIDAVGTIYPFQELGIANFKNVNGGSETLSNSSFVVNVEAAEPIEATRNYS